jgi:cytoskeletal protein CcmA (bactofilin family)
MFHRPNTPNSPNQPTTTPPQGESTSMNQPTPPSNDAADSAERSADIPATNPFQRPGQPAAPAAAAARPAASYSAYPAYGSGTATSGTAADNKRRLLIGEGITLSGEIESCDHLVVEGTVEAALKGANVLEISEKGMFYGTVEINEATIAGKFEGEITVNGRLTIRSTGSVTGAISYKELAVEAGANIDGKLTPAGSKGASSEKKSHKGASSNGASASPAAAAAKPQEDLPILQRASAQ